MRRTGFLVRRTEEGRIGMDENGTFVSVRRVLLGLFALIAAPAVWFLPLLEGPSPFPMAFAISVVFYLAGLLWLIVVNISVVLLADRFDLKRTKLLHFAVAMGWAQLLALAAMAVSVLGQPVSDSPFVFHKSLGSMNIEVLGSAGITWGVYVILGGVGLIRPRESPTVP